MASLHNSKDDFYAYAEKFLTEELQQLLNNDKMKSEFYNLCKKFSDISLNAPKIKDSKTGNVSGSFQHTDINIAKEQTINFITKYGITDPDAFMEIIHRVYGNAVDRDDKRQKAGLVKSESYNYNGGFFGTYYNFQQLPDDIWEIICTEIIETIKNNVI